LKSLEPANTPAFVVSAFYHFVLIENPDALRKTLLTLMAKYKILGTILVAKEGINGTVAGSRENTIAIFDSLRRDPRFAALSPKESYSEKAPFLRSKVKLKQEIVTLGQGDLDPAAHAGTYVDPQDWNALIKDPDVLVIDTRNDYEVEIGTFENAINPSTTTFREFPEYVREHLQDAKNKKIAMFCTGGIRCEKSTAYLKSEGFDQVYHLKGGILNYLESVPESESLWQGACFVFDERVAVEHNLQPAGYQQCHACRRPLRAADLLDDRYRPGISCHYCEPLLTDDQRARFAEREKQVQLAKARGEAHLGDAARSAQLKRKAIKRARKQPNRDVQDSKAGSPSA